MKGIRAVLGLCLLITLVCSQGICPAHVNPTIDNLKVESGNADISNPISSAIFFLEFRAIPLYEQTVSLSGWSTSGGNDVYRFSIISNNRIQVEAHEDSEDEDYVLSNLSQGKYFFTI